MWSRHGNHSDDEFGQQLQSDSKSNDNFRFQLNDDIDEMTILIIIGLFSIKIG